MPRFCLRISGFSINHFSTAGKGVFTPNSFLAMSSTKHILYEKSHQSLIHFFFILTMLNINICVILFNNGFLFNYSVGSFHHVIRFWFIGLDKSVFKYDWLCRLFPAYLKHIRSDEDVSFCLHSFPRFSTCSW